MDNTKKTKLQKLDDMAALEIFNIWRSNEPGIYIKIQAAYFKKYGEMVSVGTINKELRRLYMSHRKAYGARSTTGTLLLKHKSGKFYRWVQVEQGKWKPEHIVVAKRIGIWKPGCVIHHKNFDSLDNSPSNLVAMSRKEHGRLHGIERAKDPQWREMMSRKTKAAWSRRKLAQRIAEINQKQGAA